MFDHKCHIQEGKKSINNSCQRNSRIYLLVLRDSVDNVLLGRGFLTLPVDFPFLMASKRAWAASTAGSTTWYATLTLRVKTERQWDLHHITTSSISNTIYIMLILSRRYLQIVQQSLSGDCQNCIIKYIAFGIYI